MPIAYRSSFRAAVVWLSIMPNGRRRHYRILDAWDYSWTPSPIHASDSEETSFNKKRHKFITRKYFQLWRHNVHAAKRKVALRKVSSMMEKLMRQKKSRKMWWT